MLDFDLKIVLEAGEKAAVLVRKLLAFSRKQILEMNVVNLNELIEDVLKLLGRIIGEDVYFEINTGKEVGNIKADPSQVEQILMNLVINARDAIPEGGRINIETFNVVLDDDYTRSHEGIVPGPYVMLAITDSGKGMTREVPEEIFEPFFTTKGSQGTGLGLERFMGLSGSTRGMCLSIVNRIWGQHLKFIFLQPKKAQKKQGLFLPLWLLKEMKRY